MSRNLKVGQIVYAIYNGSHNNSKYDDNQLTVIRTTVTSIHTIETENNKIEVEYYYKDEVNKNNSSFNSYDIYTEDEFKEYLDKCFLHNTFNIKGKK